MQFVTYILLRGSILIIGMLPWFVLNILGQLFYVIIYHLLRYRRNVVYQNLCIAFSDKDSDSIIILEKQFYRHLIKLLLETLKGFHLSNNYIHERFTLDEKLDDLLSGDTKVILVGAHQGNWEWACRVGGFISQNPFYVLYSPLKNTFIDQYLQSIRARSQSRMIPFADVRSLRNQSNGALMMLGDQSPSNPRRAHLVNFFDRPTFFLRGPAFFAKKWNVPIYYVEMMRLKDTTFSVTLHLIADANTSLTEKQITQEYALALESSIKNKPYNWLWSHRKWKHSPVNESE